jgi:hypothetical protein
LDQLLWDFPGAITFITSSLKETRRRKPIGISSSSSLRSSCKREALDSCSEIFLVQLITFITSSLKETRRRKS